MSAYIVASVDVTNPEQYEEYKKWSSQAIQECGGKILVRGGAVEVLEGDWNPGRSVIVAYPAVATAKAFYNSETYGKGRAARAGAAIMRMVVIEGA